MTGKVGTFIGFLVSNQEFTRHKSLKLVNFDSYKKLKR